MNLGKIMMVTWAGFGVVIEQENESQESLELCISVPETSYRRDASGDEMAGDTLARRFKKAMTEMGVKRLAVKSRIRYGDHWTKELAENAELNMRRALFGSQY